MTEHAARSPRASLILVGGIGLSVGLTLVLLAVSTLPLLDAAFLAALLALMPSLAVAQLDAVGEQPVERIPAYGGSIVALMILTGATLAVAGRSGGSGALGLVEVPASAGGLWTLLLVAGGLGTVVAFRALAVRLGISDGPLLLRMIPRTGRERGIFAILSGWAGLGEEIAYRGFVIGRLTPITGVVGAAVISSAVFGVLHAYQGTLGMVRAGVMGGVLAVGFLATGSLWPPIVAHVVIDLLVGLVLADRLVVPDERVGVEEWKGTPGGADTSSRTD